MAVPRRRLIRTAPVLNAPDPQRQQRLQRLRTRLQKEQTALASWMARLKRSFHAVEKGQRCVALLEREIARTEE